MVHIPFYLYPPSEDELKAIFYYHRKWVDFNSVLPPLQQYTNIIEYSMPIHIIHNQLARRLLLLFHAVSVCTAYSDESKQVDSLQKEHNNVLYKKFNMFFDYHFIETRLKHCIDYVKNMVSEDPECFSQLARTLLAISNCDRSTVNQLAVMLAKYLLAVHI